LRGDSNAGCEGCWADLPEELQVLVLTKALQAAAQNARVDEVEEAKLANAKQMVETIERLEVFEAARAVKMVEARSEEYAALKANAREVIEQARVAEAERARVAAAEAAVRGWSGCKASAAVRLVCSQWQAVHDALVARLALSTETTDQGVGVLVRRFPAIVSLDLCKISRSSGSSGLCRTSYEVCYKVTDKGMRAVSNLTALKSLDLTCCGNLTDETLRSVSNLSALTSLSLHGFSKLTDEGMRAVSNLPAITSLNLAGCPKLTDDGVRAVSKLHALTYLNLSWNENVTDEGIQAVSSLPALKFLNLYECWEVSGTGLHLLATNTASPSLRGNYNAIWLQSYVDEEEMIRIEADGGW
jgi:hypothetical protein